MSDPCKLFGTDEAVAPVRRLTAGPLTAELRDGNLRAIAFGGHEVLRAIAYVVRDRDWGTYAPQIADLAVDEGADGFCVTYRAQCTAPDGAVLRFDARIVGQPGGHLSFTVEATTDAPFETNRCGFCVLHPIEGVAGMPAEITHTDGTVEHAHFPGPIAPWQPFKDIRAIAHAPAPGLKAICGMEGQPFEMEDQRAWSDASYKTYVRPLALPWPYRLDAGTVDRQCVTLGVAGTPGRAAVAAGPVALSLGEADGTTMPPVGVAIAPGDLGDPGDLGASGDLGAPGDPAWLTRLSPQYLLFHYDMTARPADTELARFARIAATAPGAETALELVLAGNGDLDAECALAAQALATAGLDVQRLVVGPAADRQSTPPGSAWPPCPPLAQVYAAARRAFPAVRLGGGMFSYFTELNRKPVPLEGLDFVTHATCPIVHAADDDSVMQTLQAIPFITASARRLIADRPYLLGPTTIAMRQNPYGSRTLPNPHAGRVAMAANDPRSQGLFGAAWLVGYAARLAGTQLDGWAVGALAGPRGLTGPDGAFPAFHVARWLAQAAGHDRLALGSADRSRVDGFAARGHDGRPVACIANLTGAPQEICLDARLAGLDGQIVDEASFDAAASGVAIPRVPLQPSMVLAPYAVVRLGHDA